MTTLLQGSPILMRGDFAALFCASRITFGFGNIS